MIVRYVPALNGSVFLGMVPNEGASDSHYVRAADYDKLAAETQGLKLDMERQIKTISEQRVEIEHLRNLMRGVGFGEV